MSATSTSWTNLLLAFQSFCISLREPIRERRTGNAGRESLPSRQESSSLLTASLRRRGPDGAVRLRSRRSGRPQELSQPSATGCPERCGHPSGYRLRLKLGSARASAEIVLEKRYQSIYIDSIAVNLGRAPSWPLSPSAISPRRRTAP